MEIKELKKWLCDLTQNTILSLSEGKTGIIDICNHGV